MLILNSLSRLTNDQFAVESHGRIEDLGLSSEQYDWYKDLRKYGSVKHSGFGLDIEKMMLFATGLTDLGDVIPFPRTWDHSNIW